MSRRRRVESLASCGLNPDITSNPDDEEETSDWGTVSDDNEEERSLNGQIEDSSRIPEGIDDNNLTITAPDLKDKSVQPKKARDRKRKDKSANQTSTGNKSSLQDGKDLAESSKSEAAPAVREEQKKDPSSVPKSRNYFLHDDRERGNDSSRYRNTQQQSYKSNNNRHNNDSNYRPQQTETKVDYSKQKRNNSYNDERPVPPRYRKNGDDLDWKHDKFEELLREGEPRPQKGDKRGRYSKKPVDYSNFRDHDRDYELYEDEGPKLVYSTGMNPDEVERKNSGRRYQQQSQQHEQKQQQLPSSQQKIKQSPQNGSSSHRSATNAVVNQQQRSRASKQQQQVKPTKAESEVTKSLAPPPGLPLNPSAREFQPDFQDTRNFTRNNNGGVIVTSQFSVADVASAWTSATSTVVAPPAYVYSTEPMSYGYEPAAVIVDEYGNPVYGNGMATAPNGYGIMMTMPPPPMVMPLAPLDGDGSIWYPPAVASSNGTVYYSTTSTAGTSTSTTSAQPAYTATNSTRSKPVVRPPNSQSAEVKSPPPSSSTEA